MKIAIINGPNLNLVGKRETEIYGSLSLQDFLERLDSGNEEVALTLFQSNVEGELIDRIQQLDQQVDGIILNPGGYAHTSVAIADAIAGISTPVVEVHISNIYAREEYRQVMLTAGKCVGVISGFGLKGYWLAIKYFTDGPGI